MSDLLFTPVGLVALLAISYAAVAVARIVSARRRRRRRVVERPNSHHTWQRVLERETRSRWDDMPLDRLHPVNRDEVVRLLGRVRAAGIDVLRPKERRFLDQMAELAGPPPAPARTLERRGGTEPTPDLRHRTT